MNLCCCDCCYCHPSRNDFTCAWTSDHFKGLTDVVAGDVYCSHITRELLLLKRPLLNSRVKVMEVGTGVTFALVDPAGQHTGNSVVVTPFDATHCPGAIMFFFEFSFEDHTTYRALYTGDFRHESTARLHRDLIKLCEPGVDIAVIDGTFFHHRYQFLSSAETDRILVRAGAPFRCLSILCLLKFR
jgi:DNA cross-link repair 1A protein